MKATTDQIYTDVSKDDYNSNCSNLTLKMDHTFNCFINNYSWDSSSIMWNWESSFDIDDVSSYNEELKTITLTAT